MMDDRPVRTRPTNNQLLYKAYFRWQHYPVPSSPMFEYHETDSCASVTAAFLQVQSSTPKLGPSTVIQVMKILQDVEALHCPAQRNVLKILSQDTRHTKVVNLACSTHRVSDELKKHYLIDTEGTQYTTNLDRNRYGADNQYMFTVIRHNLSTLGLCPCLVDVEVLDQKSNETIMVSAGIDACICEIESWRDIKTDKMSCDGRSCSPGSSAPSEEKSSGKSTSFTQPAPRVRTKQQHSQSALGEAESFRSAVNNKYPHTTSISEYDAAMGLVSVNRQPPQSFSKRSGRVQNKSPSSHGAENIVDTEQDNLRYGFNGERAEVMAGYGKRNRECETGEGVSWELPNGEPSQKSQSAGRATRTDYKRMKSSFSHLSVDSERIIMDEFSKMKSKLSGMDLLRFQMEEDQSRIRRLEGELGALKMEIQRCKAEFQQVESQHLANRRVIGMLLNRLQQSLGRNQEMGEGVYMGSGPSPSNSDRNGYLQRINLETLMTQGTSYPGASNGSMPSASVSPVPVPNSMMIALANNTPNTHCAYDAEWVPVNASSTNSCTVKAAPGQSALSMTDDPSPSDKRGLNSKLEPQTTASGFRNVFEF